MLEMELNITQELVMDQRPSATLVMFAHLLALPNWELEQAMNMELTNNPALELSEVDMCPHCGNIRTDGVCFSCLERNNSPLENRPNDDRGQDSDKEDFDLFSFVAAPRTLAEELTELAHITLPKRDQFIAEFLIGSLKDNGMLDIQIGDAVRALGVQPQRVREVLSSLQHMVAPGILARDAQECLLLQLERIQPSTDIGSLALPIIENHLSALARGQYAIIAQALHTSIDQVIAARDFIRDYLRPFPVLNSSANGGARIVDIAYTLPDVIIRNDSNHPDEFTVEITRSRCLALCISPIYRELAQSLRHGNPAGISEDERHHILDHVARAQQFIGHIRERYSTLERVTFCAVKHQKAYLKRGVRFLTSLTRLSVAEELGLHVSTVSRAVADKYVLLPSQQTEPMRVFFEVNRNVLDVVQEVIASEDHPMSDIEIVGRLADQGYHVARRTVAKYRAKLGILPSSLR